MDPANHATSVVTGSIAEQGVPRRVHTSTPGGCLLPPAVPALPGRRGNNSTCPRRAETGKHGQSIITRLSDVLSDVLSAGLELGLRLRRRLVLSRIRLPFYLLLDLRLRLSSRLIFNRSPAPRIPYLFNPSASTHPPGVAFPALPFAFPIPPSLSSWPHSARFSPLAIRSPFATLCAASSFLVPLLSFRPRSWGLL